MKQGTVSVLFGCHSVFHSALVLLSWKRLYGQWPAAWQTVCIFLHDVGHVGLDYLDDYQQKKDHWMGGAFIAEQLFGEKGFSFLAGHCSHSGYALSALYRPDKYSWYIAPTWWLWLNCIFEPKLWVNCESRMDGVRKFQRMVNESIESGVYRSTHEMYLDRKMGKQASPAASGTEKGETK
jgi:hypothetical protein